MKNITRHIETLLRRHDYVIVPEFGGFILQHHSAVIFEDSLVPPVSKVGFNPLMNISDGLLAVEISRMENVSFREAVLWIADEVAVLKSTLDKKKTVEFGKLGSLESTEEGKVIFTPSSNPNLLPANYGLTPVHCTLLQQEKTRRSITLTLPTNKTLIRYAAIGIVAVGLFISIPKISDSSLNLANILPTKHLQKSDESLLLEQKDVEPILIGIPELQRPAVFENTTHPIQEKSFHVIVGCMSTQKAADKLCSYLNNKHFENAQVLPTTKIFRVSVESFSAELEAIQFIQNLKKDYPQFSDAWVLND